MEVKPRISVGNKNEIKEIGRDDSVAQARPINVKLYDRARFEGEIILRNGNTLGPIISIKLDGIEPIEKLEKKSDRTVQEKSIVVWEGWDKNHPLSLFVFPEDLANEQGGLFVIDATVHDYCHSIGAVKNGVLTVYETCYSNGCSYYADYKEVLEIVRELGAELPSYQTVIPTISQMITSPSYSKEEKRAVKDFDFYVDGMARDLPDRGIYTWGEAKVNELHRKAQKELEAISKLVGPKEIEALSELVRAGRRVG